MDIRHNLGGGKKRAGAERIQSAVQGGGDDVREGGGRQSGSGRRLCTGVTGGT